MADIPTSSDSRRATSPRLLRLQPLHISALPSHPSFPFIATTTTTSSPPLRTFILSVLNEALSFSTSTLPSTFQRKGAAKSSAPSTAKVQLLTSTTSSSSLDQSPGETWFARRSEHVDEAVEGSASFEEFVRGVFEDHSVHEMEYTPDVFDARKVIGWEGEIAKVEKQGEGWEGFSDVAMEIYEMAHHIPLPLTNRVFPTLVVRAMHSAKTAFIVAQIPVYISMHPAAFYSNGRHRIDGNTSQKRERVTVGKYVSIESVRTFKGEGRGTVEWIMATASDAGGNLPMMLQKMGVPGAVVKDVGYFIGWSAKKRRA